MLPVLEMVLAPRLALAASVAMDEASNTPVQPLRLLPRRLALGASAAASKSPVQYLQLPSMLVSKGSRCNTELASWMIHCMSLSPVLLHL